MKKYLFLAAAVTMMASCSDNNFVGDNNPDNLDGSGAIAFGFDVQNITRGGDLVGSDAANKLQSQFVVFGTKHSAAESADATNDMVVFQNYKVEP